MCLFKRLIHVTPVARTRRAVERTTTHYCPICLCWFKVLPSSWTAVCCPMKLRGFDVRNIWIDRCWDIWLRSSRVFHLHENIPTGRPFSQCDDFTEELAMSC